MTYSARQIRELTTRSEHELVSASRAGAIEQIAAKALKSNIARARRLRDKNRDLYRRQRLATRSRTGTKQGRAAPANARTAQKAKLFEETRARFAKRLQALESSPAKARPRGNKGPKPPAHGSRKTSGPAALRQKARSPRMKAIHAHQGSRGRRNQARRDSR